MNFAKSVKNAINPTNDMKRTENGAIAFEKSGGGALLDFFAVAGSLRPRTEADIATKFAAAFAEDKLLATKMLFWVGNVRGGAGERRTFRICLKWLANNYPHIAKYNIHNIPYFNRWDSLYELVGTPCEAAMWEFVKGTITDDLKNMAKNKPVSLAAKWLKSENSSSAETKRLARKTRHALSLSARDYRKILSKLRAYIDVTECKMSAQEWNEIHYPSVPSYAMKNYNKAFKKHDGARFSVYLDSVKSGKTKINASTLYPYDLVHKASYGGYDEVVEAQWRALPNYVEGENNILVMADVSGSMYGRPIETSIGLATYFAERNTGDYHNLYMTFTNKPNFVTLDGCNSFYDKVQRVKRTNIGYSTNLMAAFDYILDHAVRNHISNKDIPKALVVVSDMEIDPYFCPGRNFTFLETLRLKFAVAGYSLPKLVLWNVEARNDTFLTKDEDVILVSGQSPSIFRELCANLNGKTAWDMMLEVLNNPVYDVVIV